MSTAGPLRRLLSRVARSSSRTDANEEIRAMIDGILGLSDTSVKEVMVPRIDSVFLGVDMDVATMLSKITDSGHSRFPVYSGTIDNVVGVLYAKDLLQYLNNEKSIDVESIARPPYFVPESKRLDGLLREMKRRRVHIAIAVDEYGGVSGLVCMEDIIEEIVGEIQDEFDDEPEGLVRLGDHAYLCDARLSIADLRAAVHVDLPDEDYDTLGGFVFEIFGKIPVRYEKVQYNGLDFVVQEMDGHKIRTIKVVVRAAEEEALAE